MDEMMTIFYAEDETVYYDYNADGLSGLRLEWQKFLEECVPIMSEEEILALLESIN